jgi:hypothetical protein
MLEIHVTADNIEELKTKVAELAVAFGVVVGEMTVEETKSGSVSGTVTGEPPKKRGRKPKDTVAAATALTEEEPTAEEEAAEEEVEGFDPFGTEEEAGEPGLDLEKLKSDTIARLQKLAGSKAGLDVLSGITSKYNTTGEKKFKFASLDSTVFVKIAQDLDTLKV